MREAPWVDAALAEYEAHRAEVLAEAQGQQHTLALGGTAVGILVAGAFNVWDDRLPATVAFLAAIPLLCGLILVQWSGRAFGMMTVGVYLEGLEKALRAVDASTPSPVLTWEETLVKMRPKEWWKPHYGWTDFGAVAVFALLAVGSVALGAYRGYSGNEVIVGIVAAAEIVVLLVFTVSLARNLATVRERARKEFPTRGGGASTMSDRLGEAKDLRENYDYLAPDGSEIRLLPSLPAGGLAHCTLPPGRVTAAVRHRTVEEIWYVLSGQGQVWRREGEDERVVDVSAGRSLVIPTGVDFQFRTTGDEPLRILIATLPEWPGADEAEPRSGRWPDSS